MIIGLNADLEKRIGYAYEHGVDQSLEVVLTGIVRCVLAQDSWLVPVETESQEEIPEEAELPLYIGGRDGMMKRLAETNDEEPVFTAFTSSEKLHMIDEEGDPEITVRYPVKNILEDLIASEVCDKLIINPNRRYIIVDKEMAEEILEHAKKRDESFAESDMKVHIEPRAIIDTNDLIAEWNKDWQEDIITENWKLHSYPVMPDGTVLVVYAMEDKVYAGYMGREAAHINSFFRVFHYRLGDCGAELINKYRFRMQDAHVSDVYVLDGKLYAVVRPQWGENYSVLQMFPNDDDAQFEIGMDVHRVAPMPGGKLAVAYTRNLHDEERNPLIVFNEHGEVESTYTDESALEVTDINLDAENRIWFQTFPSAELSMINEDKDAVDSYLVQLMGFNGFGFSDDRSRLVASYSRGEDEMQVYVMKRTEKGNYLHPILFDFAPMDAGGNPILHEDNTVSLGSSFSKSIMVLNAAGRLYVYNLNDCCDETRV